MPQNSSSSPARRGEYAAIYAMTAAVFVTALLTQPELFQSGRWIAFTVGILIFGALADLTVRLMHRPRLSTWLLVSQGMVALALLPLSNFYILAPMLTFITVSESQFVLPGRWANVFTAAVLGAIAALHGIAHGWIAALQAGAGYAAGYVFIIAFTRMAQREESAREQLELANRQLAEYAAEVERLATLRERNRLARDVHDSLGHYLTVLNVQLEIVTKLMDADPPRAHEAALRAKELASDGLAEVRRSVAALRPSPLDDQPLPQAIRHLADDTREAGLIVSFEQTGSVRPLSPEIETVLYRAAQEALTNIRKHAHASTVGVQLAFDPETVRLRVHDNGIGRREAQDDFGLLGLRERVTDLNGTVRAENHPEGGFLVEVSLPCGGVANG